jgi:hypothetical protein
MILAFKLFHESTPYGSLIHTQNFFLNLDLNSWRYSNSKVVPWDKDRDKDTDRNKDRDRDRETDRDRDRDRDKEGIGT